MRVAERVVVVGAGIAGLLAARAHAVSGADVTVVDAAHTVGGRVSAIDLDGLTLDAGAESFATRTTAVRELAIELGMEGELAAPAPLPAWVVTPDRAYPLPRTGWLGIPTEPLLPEVRQVIGWGGAAQAALERSRPLGEVADDATVGALVRERLGAAVADLLVAPVLQGVYSRALDDLPLAAIDPTLPRQLQEAGSLTALAERRRRLAPAGSAVLGIRGGVWRLPAALARQLERAGVRVMLDTMVEAAEHRDGAWHLAAGGGTLVADSLVIAAPGARSLVGVDGPAEPGVTLVTLVLDAPDLDAAPRGTGVLAVGGVTRARALTHATAKWPWLREAAGRRHVVRLSYPAADAPDQGGALADASRLLGVSLVPEQIRESAHVSWPDAAPARIVAPDMPGVELVGSAAGLSGLAAIVGAGRSAV